MALKVVLLRKKIDDLTRALEELNQRMVPLSERTVQLATREAELEEAVNEAKTKEDRAAVQALCDEFLPQQTEHREKVQALQKEIDTATQDKTAAEEELRSLEAQTPKEAPAPNNNNNDPQTGAVRKDEHYMSTRQTRAFAGMTMEQRAAFIAREDVQAFVADFRARFSGGQTRAVSGGELLIPTVMLDLLRPRIDEYSKLIKYVNLMPVSGTARQPIMGTIPEAVWTEACAALNELNLSADAVDVDGYKVGGVIPVCNALLEDVPALLETLIESMGVAIGIALDKAILFGKGVKMPLGIATRLAQTSKPSGYPDSARNWVNLSQSNVITIPSGSTTGLTLFQQILQASANAKGRYSRGTKFWAMSEATKIKLQVEATNINAAGAIVSVLDNTMPVVGGDLVVFSDDVMPDNVIIGGYGNLYLLAERAGTAVGYSDIPLYVQDKTVVKGTARYDGQPVIPEGFVVLGIGGAPTTSVDFAPDQANPAVAALSALSIGGLTLTPTFDPATDTYTAATTNATNMISAVPAVGGAVEITSGGKKVTNGSSVTWASGANSVAIKVTNGGQSKTYTVTVTKS